MDISTYISELLYAHDCIIVPGFGGFICNYQPAEIHPVLNTISPPSKALSFNRNLKSNDGLLINFIAERDAVSFYEASEKVQAWVNSSTSLLKTGEVILLRKVGKLHNDVEQNMQFEPDGTVNYLTTSFGLRRITAEPLVRSKVIEFTEKFKQETKHVQVNKRTWRMAAAIFLLASMAIVAQLMYSGFEIKQLNLDEASTFGFINRIFNAKEPEIKPLIIEVENVLPVVIDSVVSKNTAVIDSTVLVTNNPIEKKETAIPVQEENSLPTPSALTKHTYYIMIGAFVEDKNITAAKQRLQERFPDSVILMEKGNRLTKLGYSVGNSFRQAQSALISAQEQDASFWLMKK